MQLIALSKQGFFTISSYGNFLARRCASSNKWARFHVGTNPLSCAEIGVTPIPPSDKDQTEMIFRHHPIEPAKELIRGCRYFIQRSQKVTDLDLTCQLSRKFPLYLPKTCVYRAESV